MLRGFKDVVAEIQENGDRPTWWRDRLVTRVVGPLHSALYSSDFRVLDEEWDTLVVLDACRVDLFEEVVDVDRYDDYETKTSGGSATEEWVRTNFRGQALTDTVYITGNPVVSRSVKTAFHQFVDVWRTGFDPSVGTVPPDAVTDAAIAAHERFPDKRLIVHYLQPHYPFVTRPDLRYTTFGNTDGIDVAPEREGARDVWEAVALGLVDREEAWDAYRENLLRAMESMEPLLERRSGRTVVTSDHGNLIGERLWPIPVRSYGHPPSVHHSALRDVPWAVLDDSVARSERDETEVGQTEILRSLGYVE